MVSKSTGSLSLFSYGFPTWEPTYHLPPIAFVPSPSGHFHSCLTIPPPIHIPARNFGVYMPIQSLFYLMLLTITAIAQA